ncbi:hypothetical protein FOMPIDRAFT_83557 [Fomitopsis schrenkii]|uniref:Uncharacterized protein n=1 Tax=Fomitopsis schrenkii TaxID=2126942 RepID=S8EEH3_FOMSC|nr:hypothetical protein FOMPIDRAFT_83557 [Fomitopsis schrenkii]
MDSKNVAIAEYLGLLCPNCDVAIYTLVGYELLLTCDEEISLFRAKNKRIIPMLLFLANRSSLVGYVVTQPLCIYRTAVVSARDTYPTGSGHPVTAACDTNAAFSLAILAIVALVSTLRVYAISNRNRVLSSLTLSLALVRVAVNAVGDMLLLLRLTSDSPTVSWFFSFEFHRRTGLGLFRWATGASLTKVLLRDGTVFFGALPHKSCGANHVAHRGKSTRVLQHVPSLILALSPRLSQYIIFVDAFTVPVTSILASRFLMNLRRAARASTPTVDTQSPSYVRDGFDSPTMMSSVEFSPQSADFEAGQSEDDTDVSMELTPTGVRVGTEGGHSC